jgi:hypothetical protein
MHPCPYCNCDKVYVAEVEDGMLTVACPRCSMSGPVSCDGDEVEAVRGWEILCSRMCNHCRRVYIKRLVEMRRQLDARGESGDT